MTRQFLPQAESTMETDLEKIVVLGAGPIGIETALYSRLLGYRTVVLERGSQVGSNVRRWQHVQLFSPFGMNCSPLGTAELIKQDPATKLPNHDQFITGKQWIEEYLLPLSNTALLKDVFRFNHRVDFVARNSLRKSELIGCRSRAKDGFRILGQRGESELSESADIVIDTSGTFGNANFMGAGSAPAIGELELGRQMVLSENAAESFLKNGITFELPEFTSIMGELADRKILVIGSGYSAATNIVNLVSIAAKTNLEIDWMTHGPGERPAHGSIVRSPIDRIENDSLDSRDQLAKAANQAVQDGPVNWLPGHLIHEIRKGVDRRFGINIWNQNEHRSNDPVTESKEYDFLIANVGFSADEQLLSALQVQNCYATGGIIKLAASLLSQCHADCTQIKPAVADSLKTTEPNLYVIGSKSYGRNSSFLFANGLEQVKQVFSMISNSADLDLYSSEISVS